MFFSAQWQKIKKSFFTLKPVQFVFLEADSGSWSRERQYVDDLRLKSTICLTLNQ